MKGANSIFKQNFAFFSLFLALSGMVDGQSKHPNIYATVSKIDQGAVTLSCAPGLDMAWVPEKRKIYLKQLIHGEIKLFSKGKPEQIQPGLKDLVLKNPIIIYTDEDILLARREIREAWNAVQEDSSFKDGSGQKVIISWEFVEDNKRGNDALTGRL